MQFTFAVLCESFANFAVRNLTAKNAKYSQRAAKKSSAELKLRHYRPAVIEQKERALMCSLRALTSGFCSNLTLNDLHA